MIKPEHLHLLITEEIYAIPEGEKEESGATTGAVHPEKKQGTPPEPTEETPTIPEVDVERPVERKIPVAVFHEATSEKELELLKKILTACKLEEADYEVFANGFNKEVTFEKALVFVANSKVYYKPVRYQTGQLLCSRPLHQIADNQQEKAKLWEALQQFF